MRFVIVDDDRYFREEVESLIRSAPGWQDVEIERHSFNELVTVDVDDNDVFFLDIADGKDENAGIRLARRIRSIRERAHIVFVTSYNDKLRETLTGLIRPSEFLIKPLCGFEKEKLYEFLRYLSNSKNKNINLKSGAKYFDVVINDILYLRRDDRKTSVYTKNAFFQVRQSLSAIVSMLDENFLVVDKGTAVNINRAQSYDPERRLIYMENNTAIYCSRDKARLYRDILGSLDKR